MSVNPLETYLTELRGIRDSGAATRETSGYGTLAKLLDAVGHSLKPKVHCIIQLKNSGAGLPDGGLFTPDQLRNIDELDRSLSRAIQRVDHRVISAFHGVLPL